MSRFSYSKLLATATGLLMLSGCANTADSSKNNNVDLSKSNKALGELIQENNCTASFQCKVLEVGQRACGGPSRYVVYSTLQTPQEKAEQLARQITAQETAENKANGLSDCLPILPIQALCIAQRCQSFDLK
ncbi:hypothetical protein AMS58_20230 [Pseudoalteromonas porphyrae]|uniref:Lipoprotein n=1 Tax=Pseudoalteromonas neustonica TaxID=1840331 RepID=A0ABU9U6E8_9GAMM|nr:MULTISPECIES: hypothetical protein [Pseudoalteromonas]KPH92901.1 hypothetical protein AMS58_20230 [Pseudoalteromonas porphyrae]NMR27668.1 hypothetical protein [Pseudoalteromonas sp. NEC-BIFX-2020_015]NNG45331.1 hypothetical protein [Pseudoalteromonas sp. NEC-BIFX-2020_002]